MQLFSTNNNLVLLVRVIWRWLLSLWEYLQVIIFSVIWSRKNKHNRTLAGRVFPKDIVTVGNFSYGKLNVYSFSNGLGEKLEIGNFVSIADNVSFLLGGNHNLLRLTTFPINEMFLNIRYRDSISKGPIIIEDDVWIGFGSTILSGVRIGKGSVIAAGSVVVKDVEPYSVYGGNPAKLIKYRFDSSIIHELQALDLNEFFSRINESNIQLVNEEIQHIDKLRDLILKIKSK
jgi:virginiamycin A acetyltransferase